MTSVSLPSKSKSRKPSLNAFTIAQQLDLYDSHYAPLLPPDSERVLYINVDEIAFIKRLLELGYRFVS